MRAAASRPTPRCSSRLLVGLDPRRTEVVRELCETADFHGGRPWTAEVAVWDLAARALGEPLWRLLGGRAERMLAYASSGELVAPEERARRVAALRDAGVRAVKLRFGHADWRDDVAVVEAVRAAVGSDVELLVDANHGWRMAGDRGRPWDVADALQCARALEPLGVYWLEEPLPTADVEGYARLRAGTSLRIAAGEMVRSLHEARDLVLRGGVDVIQPDAVLAGGLGGGRRIAALAGLCGRMFSPAHVVGRPRADRQPAPGARRLHVPVRRGAVRPAGLGSRAPRLAARRAGRSRSRADGTVAPPPGPGARRDARPRRAGGVPAGMRIRAAVLHAYGQPLEVCELELDPPGRRRGARARGGRRRLPFRPAPGRRAPRAPGATRSCSGTRARGSSSRWGRA